MSFLVDYFVCEKQLTKNVNSFEKFTDKKRILFPIKTNPSLSVLQILAFLGIGADCASKLEIDLALYAGFKIWRKFGWKCRSYQ